MIELYAITDAAGPPLPDAASSLQAVATRGLAVVVAPAAEEQVTPESLWRHERVVESLMADRDVLPVRYGTRVPDEQSIIDLLEQHHASLADGLEFVRGAAEVAVRAYGDRPREADPDDAQPSTGSDYLRARARALADERDAARALHEPLSAAARAAMLRPTRAPDEVLRAAYLLDRARVQRFGEHVAELQRANPQVRLVCTGPWPPYSFADR